MANHAPFSKQHGNRVRGVLSYTQYRACCTHVGECESCHLEECNGRRKERPLSYFSKAEEASRHARSTRSSTRMPASFALAVVAHSHALGRRQCFHRRFGLSQ